MTIIDHPSPNHSERKAGVRVDTVLIHHTATKTTPTLTAELQAMRWLCRHGSGVSAHYLIGMDGATWRLVPEDRKAWHAGKGRLPWETCKPYDFNHRSIGIEVVNPGDGVTPFTDAQYAALEWLVPDVLSRLEPLTHIYGWSDGKQVLLGRRPSMLRWVQPAYVLGHRDVAPGRKTDPADNFDWGRMRMTRGWP